MLVATKTAPFLNPPEEGEERYGRDEMNLAAFPLALLDDRNRSRKSSEAVKTLKIADEIRDPETKRSISRKVIVTGSDEFGLPRGDDIAVLMALIQHTWKTNGFTDRKVPFERRALLEVLGWSVQGYNYKKLEAAMNRWMGVLVVYEGWWNKARNRYGKESFSLLDNVSIYDQRQSPRDPSEKQLSLFGSFFTWNDVVFQSFQDNYLLPLDDSVFFRLPSTASMNAMRFLNTDLPADGEAKRYPLEDFCCDKVGMSRTHKPSRLKQEIDKSVIGPLVKSGFLKKMQADSRFEKEGRKFAWVWFARQEPLVEATVKQTLLFEEPTTESAVQAQEKASVVAALREHGVSGKVAQNLAAGHDESYILDKIDLFEWHNDREGKVKKKTAGWLRKAIEDDYAPPEEYVPKAEREAAQKRAEATRKKVAREEQGKLLKQRLEELKRQHIKDYLDSLSEVDREQLEQDAIANATQESQEKIRDKVMGHKILLGIVTQEEVLRRCPFEEEVAKSK